MRGPVIVLIPEAAETIFREAPVSADGAETGGILLGHDTGDTITVTVAGEPGPNADRRPDGFLRDLIYAQHLADDAYDCDGSVWLGEWHTHPDRPAAPSPTDMDTYARLLADPTVGFERVLSLIVMPCPVHGWTELTVTSWIVDGSGAHSAQLGLETLPPGRRSP